MREVETPWLPPPLFRGHPQSVPGIFAKTFPIPLPACLPASLPVCLSSLPQASPGTFEDYNEYSDLSSCPCRMKEGGSCVANWNPPPFLK